MACMCQGRGPRAPRTPPSPRDSPESTSRLSTLRFAVARSHKQAVADVTRNEDEAGGLVDVLEHAAVIVRKADEMERNKEVAIRFAAERVASLREIADATGVSHMTVKRIVERAQV